MVRALMDLVSCCFPGPSCPACSSPCATRFVAWGGHGWDQYSPRLGTICAADLGHWYLTVPRGKFEP